MMMEIFPALRSPTSSALLRTVTSLFKICPTSCPKEKFPFSADNECPLMPEEITLNADRQSVAWLYHHHQYHTRKIKPKNTTPSLRKLLWYQSLQKVLNLPNIDIGVAVFNVGSDIG